MSVDLSTLTEDIDHLKQWLSKQHHLPQNLDDAWLKTFLKGCKNSIERCKETIDNYYTTRTLIPEIFSDRDPTSEEMRHVARLVSQVYLPNKTPEGYTVWILADHEYYNEIESVIPGTKYMFMLFDAHLYLESSQEWILIYDAKSQKAQTSGYLTLSFLKKYNMALKNRPIRLKQVHVINVPNWFLNVITIFKTLISEKLRKRVFVYGENYEELYNHIPREILPNEYGGMAGSIKDLNDECHKKLESIRNWFKEEEFKKSDETKRPTEMKNKLLEDTFGVDGSFRKLDVD